MISPQWQYRQIFFQQDPTVVNANPRLLCDTLLARWVNQWVTTTQQQELVDRWFFIRYGENGYHLRLRLHSQHEPHAQELQQLLDDGLLAFFQEHAPELGLAQEPASIEDLYAAGYVRRSEYEPEYAKYAGEHGVQLAEDHFMQSSRTCVQVLLAEQETRISRGIWALELVHSLVRLYGAPAYEQAILFKSNVDYWLSMVIHQRDAFVQGLEANYQRQRQSLAQRFDSDGIGTLERDYPSLFDEWNQHALHHLSEVRDHELHGVLHSSLASYFADHVPQVTAPFLNATPITSYVFVPNYIHLLQNRLGLSAAQEMQISYLLARYLEDQGAWNLPTFPLILEPR